MACPVIPPDRPGKLDQWLEMNCYFDFKHDVQAKGVAMTGQGDSLKSSTEARLFAWGVRPAVGSVCVVVVVVLVLSVTGAFAVEKKLGFNPGQSKHEVFPTRLRAQVQVQMGEGEAVWRAEYALSGSGPWTPVNSGTARNETALEIGTSAHPADGALAHYLRHLSPVTTYFVRFVVEADGEKVEEVFELTTLPVGGPEIGQRGLQFPPAEGSTFTVGSGASHSVPAGAEIETNGAQTNYEFAYSVSEAGPWQECAKGVVMVAEDFAFPEVQCTGLKPETSYFVRLSLANGTDVSETSPPVMTGTAKPRVSTPEVHNVTGSEADLLGYVSPNGSKTSWRFEYSTEEEGSFKNASSGSVSQAQAEAIPSGGSVGVGGALTGLSPGMTYYVRLVAENECAEGCGDSISEVIQFQTAGAPVVKTLATHAVHGEALRLLGLVNPDSISTFEEQTITVGGVPTGGTFTLKSNGVTTEPIAFDALASEGEGSGSVQFALKKVGANVVVTGPAGGPYRVSFFGSKRDEPQIEGDPSGLTPSGSVSVVTTRQGGEGFDTHYHFEYVSQSQFDGEGAQFKNAVSSPVVDLGSGGVPEFVGVDVPGLAPGATYRYRLVASNNSPGGSVVDGAVQALTVPAPAIEAQSVCGNERFRRGLSGHLPDCRAYEQISPINKEGAQEALKYGVITTVGTIPGEDGNHFMFMSESTRWGTGPGAGQSPYFFSRTPSGWLMTAGSPQPETGFDKYEPQVFDPNVTQFGFSSQWTTGARHGEEGGVASPNVELKAGPAGGPYVTISQPIPRKDLSNGGGLVAASEDFSTMIVGAEDHNLTGHPTGTVTGEDLYEYWDGVLRQTNVDSKGVTIGSCGAKIVKGYEASSDGTPESAHAVSFDGSRVFFEAISNANCQEPSHLYMREGHAARTLDIGQYRFAGANRQGSQVLLEKHGSQAREFSLYDAETASLKQIFTIVNESTSGVEFHAALSRDFSAIYFSSAAQLTPEAPPVAPDAVTGLYSQNFYRYNISTQTMRFVVQVAPPFEPGLSEGLGSEQMEVSKDGRFLYFISPLVGGLPGGAPVLRSDGSEGPVASEQLYRYDSSEDMVACVSCASPFDPAPKLGLYNSGGSIGSEWRVGGQPERSFVSSNGDYAFFETPSALVSEDINGETPPTVENDATRLNGSPSNDIYQWRRQGIDGCSRLQGCVNLITPGTDGYLVSLLGTGAEGKDIFFYTSSQLLSQDNDSAGDFYDARVAGGIPEAIKAIECEGDACLNPSTAPIDTTPASLSFSGPGNLSPSATKPKAKPKPKTRHCTSTKCKRKQRQSKKHKSKKSTRRATRHSHGGHR
jgi:hypothetical protein